MAAYWNPELETKAWAEVEAWQRERVATLVCELPGRSRLYAEKLAGVADDTPFAELPFTRKDELRRGQETTTPSEPLGAQQGVRQEQVVQLVSSSGTTGRPVYYGLTRHDVEVWSDGVAQSFFTGGLRPNDVVAHLVALPMVAGGWSYAEGMRRIGATVAWLGGFPFERVIAGLRALHTTAILATTSFALYLTDHAGDVLRGPLPEIGIRKVLAGGEGGLGQPEIRRRIIEGWQTDHVRENMGLGDVLSSMWSECDDASGMHFCGQGHVHVELIDPGTGASKPWTEGALGEAVYTTFDREATPVLRFRSSDHLLVTGVSCACGRTSPKVRCVGRTDDMLIYKGMNVFPSAIRDVALEVLPDRLTPYLVIRKETKDQVRFDDPIPVRVEARPELPPDRYGEAARALGDAVRQRLQVRLAVEVVPPETLPRTPYKTSLVVVGT